MQLLFEYARDLDASHNEHSDSKIVHHTGISWHEAFISEFWKIV